MKAEFSKGKQIKIFLIAERDDEMQRLLQLAALNRQGKFWVLAEEMNGRQFFDVAADGGMSLVLEEAQ